MTVPDRSLNTEATLATWLGRPSAVYSDYLLGAGQTPGLACTSGFDSNTTPDSWAPGTTAHGRQDEDRDRTFRWRRAPERSTASPDHVHVWRIDLDSNAQPTNVLEALLCGEERARAARFVHAPHRRRFAVRRAALRTILGRVDIERMRSAIPLHDIARRFFSPAEAQALLSLPAEDQPPAFFRCWCTRRPA